MENNYCVYLHLKPNNEVFYVGMGKKIRPYTKSDRSDFWWKVVNKYGYRIEIIANNLSKNSAYELEASLISKYGRKNLNLGTLVNLTDGLDGSHNVVVSEGTREKLRIARKGYIHSEETKNRISKSNIGKTVSKETKLKMSESAKKKIITQEHYDKLHSFQRGENNGMFGKKHNDKTKNLIKLKATGRIKTEETRLKFCKQVINTHTLEIYESAIKCAELNNIPLWKLYQDLKVVVNYKLPYRYKL